METRLIYPLSLRLHPFRQLLVLFAATLAISTLAATAETTPFVDDWQFTREQVSAADASSPDFAAAENWQTVRLPHDWAITGPFDPEAHGSTAKLPWKGEGWYRKTFTLEANDTNAGKRLYFDFDGVMAFPKIYLNGELVGEWDYGYTPFRIDATRKARWGQENTVVVHVNTENWGSRWYPGAGIYRKVTMTVAPSLHIAHRGTRIWTNGDELEGHLADTAFVETTLENHHSEAQTAELTLELIDPSGAVIQTKTQSCQTRADNQVIVRSSFKVDDPLLWDIDQPELYSIRSTLTRDGETLDQSNARFGFRTFAFTADDGFHLNGRRVQMKGVNLHHDLGPLGAAFNRRAAQRQLEIMQSMGVNSLRTSHNTPAAEIIELCDELGILVFNEVFDKWERTAGRPNLEPPLPGFGHRNIRAAVQRDRNSPSVVLWSVGNELLGGDEVDGIDPVRVSMMAGFVRAYDNTRPVGMGNHIPGLVNGENFASLDLTGWNYARRYDQYHDVWPSRPIIYSESASTVSTRGYYEPELPTRHTDYSPSLQVSSYDLTAAAWSDIPDKEFQLMKNDTYVAGEYVWTGFDYLGEPTPFDQEARSSYFGIVDLCGFPKDRYYLYKSHWLPDETTVHILPHWNWPDREGQNVPVFVYTNGDSAELFLNGRSLGMRRKGDVPDRAPNLVTSAAKASASSEAHPAALAHDAEAETGWRAEDDDAKRWWQIDLGSTETIRFIGLDTPRKENLYAYTLSASTNGKKWTTLVEKPTARYPLYSGPSRVYHEVDTQARYLRVVFNEALEDAPVGLDTFMVHSEKVENDYYDVTYDYRLRWNEVAYERGELRAVAYRNGEEIGDAVVATVGDPTALRLTADRDRLAADGEDLAFITIEAVDAEGRPHPLADNLARFTVKGPASIAAVGNGNPLSFEPFQADQRQLFYGKALLIIRPDKGSGGAIEITAEADGLTAATVTLQATP